MARRMANKAAVETNRKRLGLTLQQFSEALGYGASAYGDMERTDKITQTAALAAECLVRRQSPGALLEVTYLTRIVRGIPHITMIDGDLREMTLDGERFLLLPKDEPRRETNHRIADFPKPAGNGAEPTAQPALDYAEPAHA